MKYEEKYSGYSVGDYVKDCHGYEGIIVKIIPGVSIEDHGAIYVWQMDRTEYGIDNCESYAEFELFCKWVGNKRALKILKKAGT